MSFAFNIIDGEHLLALSRDLLAIAGYDGYLKQVNENWQATTGFTPDELLSRPWIAFVHPEDRTEILQKLTALSQGATTEQGQTRFVLKDGNCSTMFWRAVGSARTRQVYLTVYTDQGTRGFSEFLQSLTENSSEVIQTFDRHGIVDLCSKSSQSILGHSPENILQQSFFEGIRPEDVDSVSRCLKEAVRAAGESRTVVYSRVRSDGTQVKVESVVTSRLHEPAVNRIVSITRRPKVPGGGASQNSGDWKERFDLAAQGTTDGIWEWDLTLGTCYYSPRWKEILGLQDTELTDAPSEWFDRVHPSDRDRLNEVIGEHFEGKTPHFEVELRIRNVQEQYIWVRSRGVAMRNPEGEAYLMSGSLADITDRTVYDPLTHLPNRNLFVDRLQRVIEHKSGHPSYTYAVLLVDVDRFKNINDSMGHNIGDELLCQLAQRLLSCVKARDMVARFAGDEFIILLDDINKQNEASEVANRIQEKIMWPFHLDGQEVYITSSIGITLGTRQYREPAEILRDADIALHRSKEQGKARHEFFSTGMFQFAIARMRLENDLRRVLDRSEMMMYYQPIISLRTGRLIGFEALIRWPHPEIGMISPAEFIPVAEETGAIIEIGRWVIRESCHQLTQWNQQFNSDGPTMISVNLSSRQFADPDLIGHIDGILAETGLPPQRLRLEITETALMDNTDAATDILRELQLREIRLALDDFGTGYSSLAYLHRFPVSYLKIDRSFVSRIGHKTDRSAIVQTIVTLAQNLNMLVIAEGVETADQLEVLRHMNCDFGQGYLFGKPLPADAATKLIIEQRIW